MIPRASSAQAAFAVRVAGRGRPVIFIPGFACSGAVWDGTLARMGDDVEAHVLTIAGFAGQPPVASPTLGAVRDQIAQYIVDRDLDRPILVGHSLGGTIALWVAQIAPMLGGVVTIDGASFLPALSQPAITRAEAVAAAAQRAGRIAALSADELGGFIRDMFGHMFSDPQDLDRVVAHAAESDVATLAAFAAEGLPLDIRADLSKITTRVTLIAAAPGGADDQLRAAWHAQLEGVADARFVFVDARHFVMLDQPDEFHALLNAQLST